MALIAMPEADSGARAANGSSCDSHSQLGDSHNEYDLKVARSLFVYEPSGILGLSARSKETSRSITTEVNRPPLRLAPVCTNWLKSGLHIPEIRVVFHLSRADVSRV